MAGTETYRDIILNIESEDAKHGINVSVVPTQIIGADIDRYAELLGLDVASSDTMYELTNEEGLVLPKFETWGNVASDSWLNLHLVARDIARVASGPGAPPPLMPTRDRPAPTVADVPVEPQARLDQAIGASKRYLPDRGTKRFATIRNLSMALARSGYDQRRSVPASAGDLTVEDLTVQRKQSRLAHYRSLREAGTYSHRLHEAIAWGRMREPAIVAFVSSKGGVGKTTTASLFASLLAFRRQERVLVIDNNPDYGTLGFSLAPDARFFVDDMAELFAGPTPPKWIDVEAMLSHGPNGLLVLPAPRTAPRMAALSAEAYRRVIEGLAGFVNAIVLDCGTGMFLPVTVEALRASSQVVVVSDADPATGRPVAQALSDVLDGFDKPTTLVVNRWQEKGARLDLGRLTAHIQARADVALTLVSECRAGAEALNGARFDWRTAPSAWEDEVGELGAVVVGRWRDLGVVLSD